MGPRLLLFTAGLVLTLDARAEEPKQLQTIQNTGRRAIIVKAQSTSPPPSQAAVVKRIAEAQKSLAQAQKALLQVQRLMIAAKTPEEKAEAAKKVAEAKKLLEKARADVQARMDAARRAPGVYVTPVKEVKNADDPIERFLLFTPSGPLLVEAEITAEGKPFRQLREPVIDKMMKFADADKDGKPTWDEALKSHHFTFGRVRIVNDGQKESYLENYDLNKNGLVEREEVRRFLPNVSRSDAFTISGGVGSSSYRRSFLQANVDLVPILDEDGDRALSAAEIGKASERLKSRDADDNDLLYPLEVATNNSGNNLQLSNGFRQTGRSLAVSIGPSTTDQQVFSAIQQQYRNADGEVTAESFSLAQGLFASLDENENGKLEPGEVRKLEEAQPQLAIKIDLGENGKGVQIQRLGAKAVSEQPKLAATASFPRMMVKAIVNRAPADYPSTNRISQSYMSLYDNDKNGYLDKKELMGVSGGRLMAMWDSDGDGKLFGKEIVEYYQQYRAPETTQVRATVAFDNGSLFQALDMSGDQRLSLREMRTAAEQLKSFDKNEDRKIAPDEIPVTIALTFARGYGYYVQRGRPVQGRITANPAPKTDAPDWFTRMDRNGDGDVTIKEFLGDKEQFKKLDANNDGFIEPKEAKAAEK